MSAEVTAVVKSDRQMLEEIHAMTMQTRNDINEIRTVIESNVKPMVEKLASNPMIGAFLG